jgi:hypothetical protein
VQQFSKSQAKFKAFFAKVLEQAEKWRGASRRGERWGGSAGTNRPD